MSKSALVYIIFGCLHAFGVFGIPLLFPEADTPFSRNWGYHTLAYTTLPVIVVAYGLFVLSLIPSVQEKLRTAPNQPDRKGGRRDTILWLVVLVVSVGILWQIRQKYAFLGDGHVRAGELDAGIAPDRGGLYFTMLYWIVSWTQLTAKEAIQVGATALVIPFLGVTSLVARELRERGASPLSAYVLVGGAGILQLYAGYVETYAPLPIFALLATSLGLKADNSRQTAYASLFVSLFAGLLHPLGALCSAGAVLTLLERDIRSLDKWLKYGSLAIAFVVVVAVAISFWDEISPALLPLRPDGSRSYALFTIRQRMGATERSCSVCSCSHSPAVHPEQAAVLSKISCGPIPPMQRASGPIGVAGARLRLG